MRIYGRQSREGTAVEWIAHDFLEPHAERLAGGLATRNSGNLVIARGEIPLILELPETLCPSLLRLAEELPCVSAPRRGGPTWKG